MEDFASELSWWGQSTISAKVDLSEYRSEVHAFARPRGLLFRGYAQRRSIALLQDEAFSAVRAGLFDNVSAILKSCIF